MIGAMIGLAITILLNVAIVAYGYGKLNQKVDNIITQLIEANQFKRKVEQRCEEHSKSISRLSERVFGQIRKDDQTNQ